MAPTMIGYIAVAVFVQSVLLVQIILGALFEGKGIIESVIEPFKEVFSKKEIT
jgi:hypothetical protein